MNGGTFWNVNEPPSKLRYSIEEAATLLGVGRTTLYRRISYGSLSVVRDGGRVFVTRDELMRYAADGSPVA